MLLSASGAIRALQGSVYQAAREQLRGAGRHMTDSRPAAEVMTALYRRKIAAEHLDRTLAPVLSEVASGCTEPCMEERRAWCYLTADASLERKEKPALLSFFAVSFDSTTGVAFVELVASGTAAGLEAGLLTLVRFGPSLRAVTLHIARANQLGQSSRTLDRERRSLEALHDLRVPLVCSAAGSVGGSALALRRQKVPRRRSST